MFRQVNAKDNVISFQLSFLPSDFLLYNGAINRISLQYKLSNLVVSFLLKILPVNIRERQTKRIGYAVLLDSQTLPYISDIPTCKFCLISAIEYGINLCLS